jgi:hypothetical protein
MRDMRPFETMLVAMSIAAAAPLMLTAQAVAEPDGPAILVHEVSAAQRQHQRRYARPHAPARVPFYVYGADPSLARNGKPYPVPEYLRNQCYIDEGYGRFSACKNR